MAGVANYTYTETAYGGVVGYSVVWDGIGTPDRAYIPYEYNGKPVLEIGYAAFNECTSLEEVIIPESIKRIARGAFRQTSIRDIIIPDSVEEVGGVLFAECSELRTAKIGEGLTTLTESMFIRCSNLRYVEIPDGITIIEEEVFAYCTALSKIALPESVTRIGNSAFYGCTSLQSIIISASVTSMGFAVFKGCSSLKEVTLMPETPPDILQECFDNTYAGLQMYCLGRALNLYKNGTYWVLYANKIVADDFRIYFTWNADSTKEYVDAKTHTTINQEFFDSLYPTED